MDKIDSTTTSKSAFNDLICHGPRLSGKQFIQYLHTHPWLGFVLGTVILLVFKIGLILFFNYLLTQNILHINIRYPDSSAFLNAFAAQWDSWHYLNIAENGYPPGEVTLLYAFNPLYPWLIKGGYYIFRDYLISALVISHLSYFGSLCGFYLAAREYTTPNKAVGLMIIFGSLPTYFVYSSFAYSESLYLLFSTFAIYFFKRKKYWALSLCLTGAFMAKYIGGVLLPLFVLGDELPRFVAWLKHYISKKRNYKKLNFKGLDVEPNFQLKLRLINWQLLWLLIPSLIFIIWCVYLYNRTGSYFAFMDSHRFFDDQFENIIAHIRWFFDGFFFKNNPAAKSYTYLFTRLIFTIPFLFLAILTWFEDRFLGFFALIFMYITLSMSGISAIASPRIMLAAWTSIFAFRSKLSLQLVIYLFIVQLFVSNWVMYQFFTSFFA